MQDSRSRIELFGGVRLLREDGETARFRTRKTAALLGYLALFSGRSHAREEIAELFWPDAAPEDGRNNLSTALTALRRLLEPPGIPAGTVLQADRAQIGLNPLAITTDAADFARELHAERRAETLEEKYAALRRAVNLYSGDLMAGHYDSWLIGEQARRREQWLDALQRFIAQAEQAQDWDAALDAAGRLLTAEPTLEEAAQAKMRLLARQGRFDAAQKTFRELEKRLKMDLDAAPSQETVKLRAHLKSEKSKPLPVPAPLPPSAPSPASVLSEAMGSAAPDSSAFPAGPPVPPPPVSPQAETIPLPLRLTRFFGRESDLTRLRDLLQIGPDSQNHFPERRRLITLTGPGGAGKTRAALEAAAGLTAAFSGRVWFVALENAPDARLFPFALARALKIPLAPRQEPLEPIFAALGQAPALLLLDNFEHLLRKEAEAGKPEMPDAPFAANIVRLLLSRLPSLTVIITSRRVLGLEGEQEFPLAPLPIPAPDASLTALRQCASVALYTDRARAVNPDFVLTPRNAAAVGALCRRLEGMPLALEIAAGWVKTLPPAAMLEQAEAHLLALESRRRDLPPRQRSLRALIEWSYALLTPEQRETLAKISVFRGGWTLEAARAVCGPEALPQIADLQAHSLAAAESDPPRFRLLTEAREFALSECPADIGLAAQAAHARYFAVWAEQGRPDDAATEAERFRRIEGEYENLQTALTWAEQNDLPLAMRTACDLSYFWQIAGRWQEGEQRLETALRLCNKNPKAVLEPSLYWRLVRERASFAGWRGDYALAQTSFESSLQWSEENGSTEDIAAALKGLGFTAARRGAMQEAIPRFEAALAHFRLLRHPRGIRDTLLWLAYAAQGTGDGAQAATRYAEALALARQAEDATAAAIALTGMGTAAHQEGAYPEAEIMLTEALALCREIGMKRFRGYCLLTLGDIARRRGVRPDSRLLFREGLITMQELNERESLLDGMRDFALLLAQEGRMDAATRLLAAAKALRESGRANGAAETSSDAEAALAEARCALGAHLFERCYQEGSFLNLQQAAELALTEAAS